MTEKPLQTQVRVGVGVFVFNDDGSFIVGKRIGSHGAGKWALPGGHLEFGESFETCAAREVLEESGLHVKDNSMRFLAVTNDVMASEHKHYVTIFMGCRPESEGQEPKIMEPGKCERWEWVTWQDVRRWSEGQKRQQDGDGEAEELGPNSSAHTERRPLFLPLLNLLRQQSDPCQSYKLRT